MELIQPKLIKTVFSSTENSQKIRKSLIDTKKMLKIGPLSQKMAPNHELLTNPVSRIECEDDCSTPFLFEIHRSPGQGGQDPS